VRAHGRSGARYNSTLAAAAAAVVDALRRLNPPVAMHQFSE